MPWSPSLSLSPECGEGVLCVCMCKCGICVDMCVCASVCEVDTPGWLGWAELSRQALPVSFCACFWAGSPFLPLLPTVDRKRRTRDRVGCGLGSGGLNGTGSGWGWGMGIRRGLGPGNGHGRRGGDGTRQSNATAHRADEGQRGNQSWIDKSARYAP